MRGARRTRPAGKAKGRATEERVNMKAKEEDLATKGNTQRREREEECPETRERGGVGPNGA